MAELKEMSPNIYIRAVSQLNILIKLITWCDD